MRIWFLAIMCPLLISCNESSEHDETTEASGTSEHAQDSTKKTENLYCNDLVEVGAEIFNQYLFELENKRVAVVGNQTSMVGNTHLVDTLLSKGVNIVKVFSPEHGFRGDADAGEKVDNSKDPKTGLPIISLYGKNKKPTDEQLSDVDIIVFDIQDVGARFYTYISTLTYVMEAAAENDLKVVILDRPNPNGFYVDGPLLKNGYDSFVGMHHIPIVHGMTIGEYALMINDSNLVTNNKGIGAMLNVVQCKGWDHRQYYELPIAPSPNLPDMKSVYWYPSLCLFEGTVVSIGRGTDIPFQCVGHPEMTNKEADFNFTPAPNQGAKNPKLNGEECFGYDLSTWEIEEIRGQKRLNLSYLLNFYSALDKGSEFFVSNGFFNLLAGSSELRKGIEAGMSEEEIRERWQSDINTFKKVREKYLLYTDFE
ncbi:DUF1343 domain-containing protein [Paracrocinitomix mangrovi]|uniref:exo-beta-N-acetylmuramidase NamZ family protein n=1 Tax=Paracrocinitomix mangrovi TaxID=2862509 RepID=UPI001EDB1046|nr:DUF1343 domain-containing protein [Paracrocinitomix mangrovi]UKN03062.1 DUF1343 domain-containing protein [Paracrocinitomix mangrovi]